MFLWDEWSGNETGWDNPPVCFSLSRSWPSSGSREARESSTVVILSVVSFALMESSSWVATWDSGRGTVCVCVRACVCMCVCVCVCVWINQWTFMSIPTETSMDSSPSWNQLSLSLSSIKHSASQVAPTIYKMHTPPSSSAEYLKKGEGSGGSKAVNGSWIRSAKSS